MTGFPHIRHGLPRPAAGSRRAMRKAARALILAASVAGAALVGAVSVPAAYASAEPPAAQQPATVNPSPAGGSHESGGHGLPESAVEIGRPFGVPVTNSMVVTWIVAIVLIVFARAATRKMTRGPRARTEPDGMADREPLRVSREHHRAAPRQADLLVFRDRLHLHPRRQLDQPLPWRGHNRLGPSHGPRILDRPAALPGRQRRSEPDAGDVAGLLRPAGSSGR